MHVHERTPVSSRASMPGALREALLVFTVVSALIVIASRLEALPLVRNNLHLVVGTLFLLVALRRAERLPGGLPRYGLALGGLFAAEDEARRPDESGREAPAAEVGGLRDLAGTLLAALPVFARELRFAALVCALIFPPFVLCFYLWHAPAREFVLVPQPELGSYLLTQVMVVGLPEEAFFRGYLQGRLADALPGETRWLGMPISPAAWLLQAALFAVLHFVVDLQPARLAVFFPALLFGWIAGLRGGIGAAVFVHAACNVLSDLLVRGWL